MKKVIIKWIVEGYGTEEVEFNDLGLLPDCVDENEIWEAAQKYMNMWHDGFLDSNSIVINVTII